MTHDQPRDLQLRHPLRGVIGLLNALIATGLIVWGFLGGINSALDGSGSGAHPIFYVLFFGGAVLLLIALIVAIYRLVKGRYRVLAVITIIVCLLPIIAMIILRVAAMSSL